VDPFRDRSKGGSLNREDAAQVEALRLASANTEGSTQAMFIEQMMDKVLSSDSFGAAPAIVTVLRKHGNDASDEFAQKIEARFNARMAHLDEQKEREMAEARPEVDVLILTVKKTEFRAALDAFGVAPGVRPTDLGDGAEAWLVSNAGTRYGIAMIGNDGNVESAIEVKNLFKNTAFRAAILLGMAAGVRGEVDLGDVVVAHSVYAYDFVRATKVRSFSRAKPYSPSASSWQRVDTLHQVHPGWAESVAQAVLASPNFEGIDESETKKLGRDWRPRIKVGAVLAGSVLIEDNRLVRQKREGELHDRVLAAEMEGAGFAAACMSEGVQWMVVRGVADFGGFKRRKSWQYPATYAAACAIRDGIESGRINFF
jgi:nucleoside phosphorylase